MPARTTRWAGRPSIRTPSNSTRPAVGARSPEMALSRVDFPAPLEPSKATISPRCTEREMPCKAGTPAYAALRSWTRSAASGTEIRLDHPRIAGDLPGRTLGDAPSGVQHHHPVAHRHDHLHHVLHHQARDPAAAQPAQDLERVARLGRVDPA